MLLCGDRTCGSAAGALRVRAAPSAGPPAMAGFAGPPLDPKGGTSVEITEGDVRHLEALALLRLDAPARERMRGQLQRILDYVDQLNAIDITGVPPTYHVIESSNVLRPDEVQPSLSNDAVLGNAPDAQRGFYRVPRFVGETEEPA